MEEGNTMKRFLQKASLVVLLMVVISMLFAPIAKVHAGEEDIPRTFINCIRLVEIK